MRKRTWTSRATVIVLLIMGQLGCAAGPGAGAGAGKTAAAAGSPRRKLEQAQQAVAGQKYTEAISLCDAVIAAEPDNAEAYKVRGLARMSIPYVPRPAAPPRKWTDPHPKYAPEPEWIGRLAALKDLKKAGELRGDKDPVVWYLQSVFHTKEAHLHTGQRMNELRQATDALREAEKLDPKHPGYRRARELLVPQAYFARRDAHLDQSPYTGQYADVVRFGDTKPYGEIMKGYGWVPGTAWTPPAPRAAPRGSGTSASGGAGEPVDPTVYILLGIGALVVLDAMSQGGGGSGGGGNRASSSSTCWSCGGRGQVPVNSTLPYGPGAGGPFASAMGSCTSCGGDGRVP